MIPSALILGNIPKKESHLRWSMGTVLYVAGVAGDCKGFSQRRMLLTFLGS